MTASTTKSQEEDWDQDLVLPPPTVEWQHLVNQTNQDPREDSVTDFGWGTAAMEEGDTDTVGDEEVEEWDEGATAGAVPETSVAKPGTQRTPTFSLMMRIPACLRPQWLP